jgi:hypothetical protein
VGVFFIYESKIFLKSNMKIKYLETRLQKSPSLKSFLTVSRATRNRRYKLFNMILNWISGGIPSTYLLSYFENNSTGRKYYQDIIKDQNLKKLVDRINHLHSTSPMKQKSKVLSLLSGIFNISEMKDMGIKVSRTQYRSSLKYINSSLSEMSRKSSRKSNEELKRKVAEFLILNSSDSRMSTQQGEPIYYYSTNKIQLYKKFQEMNTETKISLSFFYKNFPKNFKKATKKTDLCPVCKNGEKLMKINREQLSFLELREFNSQMKLYKRHLEITEYQRDCFKAQVDLLQTNQCIIIMDFKQNIKLGGSSMETSRDFYSKPEVSIFGFSVHYYDTNLHREKKSISFVSENLTHDTHFVKSAIVELLEKQFLSHINNFSFWSDCGNHFRSKELIYFILKDLKSMFSLDTIQMNYFPEYHGKNEVDGNFGVLTRWFRDGELNDRAQDIEDLILYFRERSLDTGLESSQYLFHVFTPGPRRRTYKRLKMKDFKLYLSFLSYGPSCYCCFFSSSNIGDYQLMGVLFEIIQDTRGTRVSLKKGRSAVMGSLLENATNRRHGFLKT